MSFSGPRNGVHACSNYWFEATIIALKLVHVLPERCRGRRRSQRCRRRSNASRRRTRHRRAPDGHWLRDVPAASLSPSATTTTTYWGLRRQWAAALDAGWRVVAAAGRLMRARRWRRDRPLDALCAGSALATDDRSRSICSVLNQSFFLLKK